MSPNFVPLLINSHKTIGQDTDIVWDYPFLNPKAERYLFCWKSPDESIESVEDDDCFEKTKKEVKDFEKGKIQIKYIYQENPFKPKR